MSKLFSAIECLLRWQRPHREGKALDLFCSRVYQQCQAHSRGICGMDEVTGWGTSLLLFCTEANVNMKYLV